jgi:hypothetical protein
MPKGFSQFFGRQLIGSAEMKKKKPSLPPHGLTVQTQNQSSLIGGFHVRGRS